jgi:hypothetical protein
MGHTACLGVLPHVFLDGELVGAGFVFGDDASDDGHAAFFDLRFEGCEVVVEMAEADFGDDGGPLAGDEVVFGLEGLEQALPACDDSVFVAVY